MIGETMRVSTKELFYAAMMLKLDKLVNVEYSHPMNDDAILEELNEVKHSLRKKKLLKENARGKISLELSLTACAALCSEPDSCEVRSNESGYYATIYKRSNAYLLVEHYHEGLLRISWFNDKIELDEFIASEMNKWDKGGRDI